jgi:hypothetical protein
MTDRPGLPPLHPTGLSARFSTAPRAFGGFCGGGLLARIRPAGELCRYAAWSMLF